MDDRLGTPRAVGISFIRGVKLTTHLRLVPVVEEWVELCFHSPNTPAWRGVELGEHRDKFTFFTFLFVCSNRALYYSNK
jgi:hypothetical protein